VQNVLVVEDEKLHQMLIKRAFDGKGHNVVFVGDGREAIAYLKTQPVDLVLLDLNLPYVSGHEVMAQMNGHKFAVIVMTSSDNHDDVQKAYDLGAASYVVKPVDYQQVISRAVDWYFSNDVRLPGGLNAND